MPVLSRNTIDITLPDHGTKEDPAILTMYDRITVGDLELIDEKAKVNMPLYDLYMKLIVKWNFTDEKGAPLPINKENMKLLSMDDIDAISSAIKTARQLDVVKKNS